jgi:hypothetical protein
MCMRVFFIIAIQQDFYHQLPGILLYYILHAERSEYSNLGQLI